MSLKSFHIFFVAASLTLGVLFAVWCANVFMQDRSVFYLILGILSVTGSVALSVYLTWFLRKIRHLGV